MELLCFIDAKRALLCSYQKCYLERTLFLLEWMFMVYGIWIASDSLVQFCSNLSRFLNFLKFWSKYFVSEILKLQNPRLFSDFDGFGHLYNFIACCIPKDELFTKHTNHLSVSQFPWHANVVVVKLLLHGVHTFNCLNHKIFFILSARRDWNNEDSILKGVVLFFFPS